jgi:hypothetical protein
MSKVVNTLQFCSSDHKNQSLDGGPVYTKKKKYFEEYLQLTTIPKMH